jgi:hypothetical protein
MRLVVAFVLAVLICPRALAWHAEGHQLAARAAVRAVPATMPAFFREGGQTVAHLSIDPDVARNPLTPQLTSTEAPEHFVDLELVPGGEFPPTRYEFVALCIKHGQDPKRVGTLPYSISEWTQRLALAFAEHRRWPDNEAIKLKCLVYAGILSHYSADLCMPLHTTIHYDGRANAEGKSPRSGIHEKIDDLPGDLMRLGKLNEGEVVKDLKPRAFERVLPATVEAVRASHALIDRVYELEPALPPNQGSWERVNETVPFTLDRMRASAEFTASLFQTAWELSAKIELPKWLER